MFTSGLDTAGNEMKKERKRKKNPFLLGGMTF